MLCTSVVGCLSEIFISLLESKDSDATEKSKTVSWFLFSSPLWSIPSAFPLHLSVCLFTLAGSSRNSSSQCSPINQWCTPQQVTLAGTLPHSPGGRVVLVLLLCWTPSIKKGRNCSSTSQDFARTKEAEIRGWVMKCDISQQKIDPKRCTLNVCSKVRSRLDVNGGKRQADSFW